MSKTEHYAKLEREALRASMQPLADLWKERREAEELREQERRVKAHTSALMRDYAKQNHDLLEDIKRRNFWREMAGGFVLTSLGLFIGYLITAAF